MVGDIHPVLPHGRNIIEFMEHHFQWVVRVKGMTIPLIDLERLETQVVLAVVLPVLANEVFHQIIGGKKMLVESVLEGTYYGWS